MIDFVKGIASLAVMLDCSHESEEIGVGHVKPLYLRLENMVLSVVMKVRTVGVLVDADDGGIGRVP